MLVGFGQVSTLLISNLALTPHTMRKMRCLPVGPKCDECDLSVKGLCPSAQKPKAKRSPIAKAEVQIELKMEDDILESLERIEDVKKESMFVTNGLTLKSEVNI